MRYEVEKGNLTVEYSTSDASFYDGLGNIKDSQIEIDKITLYVEEISAYVDVTHMNEFSDLANRMIVDHLLEAA
jgi:hypothetical protein